MFVLSPGMVRALLPACPPTWFRLATLAVIAGFALLMLGSGVPVNDVLVTLAVVCGLTLAVSATGSATRAIVRGLRAALPPCDPFAGEGAG